MRWFLRLFKRIEPIKPTYLQMFYQGRDGWHDNNWSIR